MDGMLGDLRPGFVGPASRILGACCSIWRDAPAGRARMERPGSGNGGGDAPGFGLDQRGRSNMVALVVLLLLLLLLGGLGFAAHVLWYVLIAAVILWLIGFFIGGAANAGAGGRRGWYRW
jgi:hypothetical protein